MARRSMSLELLDRGERKEFEITEMSATRLEAWLARALIALGPALGKGEGEPADLAEAGAELGRITLMSLARGVGALDYDKAKPLWDELLGCCKRKDTGMILDPGTVDGYIADVATLIKLKMEAAKFNLSFLGLAALTGSRDKPNS